MQLVAKQCEICGKPFSVPKSRERTAKTCGRMCRGKWIAKGYAEKRVRLTCQKCGGEFNVPKCHAHRRLFCSDACATEARHANNPCGEAHYRWRGGVTIHSAGYRYMSLPDHPLAEHSGPYIFEHRVVMEQWMRRESPDHAFLVEVAGEKYLRPEIHVHHINGVKADNRRHNLLACTSAAHLDIHQGIAPMCGEVWPEIEGLRPFAPRWLVRQCPVCGEQFRAKASTVARGGARWCSRKCYNARNRDTFRVRAKEQ